jgi:Fur family ferric uptake transcriptional regulator
MQDLLQICVKRLKERGLRLTAERRAILRSMLRHRRHFDPEGLLNELRRDGVRVSRATVYRTLGHLTDTGLLRRYDLGDRQTLYEISVGREHHEHLICTRCGMIFEFVHDEIERLQDEVCHRFRFEPIHHSLQIYGVCAECSRLEPGSRSARDRRKAVEDTPDRARHA